jgi:hypothetical protein
MISNDSQCFSLICIDFLLLFTLICNDFQETHRVSRYVLLLLSVQGSFSSPVTGGSGKGEGWARGEGVGMGEGGGGKGGGKQGEAG